MTASMLTYQCEWGAPRRLPRTTALCFDSHEWCYPDSPCDLCNRSLMGDPWEIIQRVRDVCADEAFWAESGPDAELVRAVTVEAVFAALNGERDD